jgi:ER-bound oxygenase mpaB/B'/Rubber oxygenase, catalytic domain
VPDSKWSDDRFLDQLKHQSDELADQTVKRLIAEHGMQRAQLVFQQMRSDDSQLPADAPEPIREFIERTRELPASADRERLDSEDALLLYGPAACLVMLASSLPRGYAAPRITEILTISDDLEVHPYKRLMGVLQLLVDLGGTGAFAPGGRAVLAAQKMRLLHAGIRHLTPRYRPTYHQRYGIPVNHEDMLGTIMGFSYLVHEGMKKLGRPFSEDKYYRWRVFAQLMGIHPPGRPDDDSWIPANYEEAALFYASYERRHYTGPEENPAGVRLTRANLALMEHLIPKVLRRLGFGVVPRIAMTELLSKEDLARVGFQPMTGHKFAKALFSAVLFLAYGLWSRMSPDFLWILCDLMHKEMIQEGRGGTVTFTIPTCLADLRSAGLV